MKTSTEFDPLDTDRANELNEIINKAASQREALIFDPQRGGISGMLSGDLISPNENTNALVRYQRHY